MEKRLELGPATAAAEEEVGGGRLGGPAAVAVGEVEDSRAGSWR